MTPTARRTVSKHKARATSAAKAKTSSRSDPQGKGTRAGKPVKRAKAARPAGKPRKGNLTAGTAGARKATLSAASPAVNELFRQAFARHQGHYECLSAARRKSFGRTMHEVATLLLAADSPDPSRRPASFELRAQTALDTLRAIALGDSGQLQAVIYALEPVASHDPDTVDLEEAEARGRLRLQALYQKIIADSYSVKELTAQWRVSRQRLAQLREEDRLFAVSVPFHKGLLYPRWQLGADLRPRPIMPNLIQQAKRSGLDAIDFHQLMTNPASGNGTSPVEMLDRGEEQLVLGIIRATEA
jgi:hypothetical protein